MQETNAASFVYSLNMLRLLRKMDLITDAEYKKIAEISAAHYGIENIII